MMFLENKYSRTYFAIVEKRKAMPASGNVEKHHIIPLSLGGFDNPENLVALTLREHYICHLLLIKMTVGNDKRKMYFALNMMASMQKDLMNSVLYESIKQQYVAMGQSAESNEKRRKTQTGQKRSPHSATTIEKITAAARARGPEWRERLSASAKAGGKIGKFTRSAETRMKMSEAQKIAQTGKVLSDAHKEKLSIIMKANPTPEFNFKGRKHSEETKQKMAAARRAYYAEKETT